MCSEREKFKALEGFEAANRKAIVVMQAFKDSCAILTKLSSGKSISFTNGTFNLSNCYPRL